MPVTFIIGRAGSGKTARCFARIRQMLRDAPLGPPIYLIVPNQATFQVEREMMAGTGGFSRLSVVSFDLLGRQIATECGDAAVPEVTALGRQLILAHLLRRHRAELHFFGGVAHQPGMAAELDATFAELERSGKTDADLAKLLETLERSDPEDAHGPALQAKLRDLRFLYDAYQKYLGQDRLDQHRRLTQAVARLQDCATLRHATVFVDDFYSFTEYERRFLAGLGRACPAVEINLTFDPSCHIVHNPEGPLDDMSLFHKTERAYRQLLKAFEDARVRVNDVVKLEGLHRFQSADLLVIEREAFAVGPASQRKQDPRDKDYLVKSDPARSGSEDSGTRLPAEPLAMGTTRASEYACPWHPATMAASAHCSGLRLVEAPDLRAEVDAAARGIVDLLREGYRLRDVAVLARDLGPYQQLIDTSFPEHGLSSVGGPSYYFVDRRRTAEHHPLLAFVRAMFQIVLGRWPLAAVMSFLKTGLAGVTLLEADEIENYLIQHRLGGAAWDDAAEWAYQREMTAPSEQEPPLEVFDVRDIEAMRRGVVGGLQPFIEKLGEPRQFRLRDIAAEVFATFERFNVRTTLSNWAAEAIEAGQPEQGAEHEQVWAELVDLFEQIVDLLGDELASIADFVDILEWGLERFTLALTPPTVDQVLVGQVGRTRTPEVKAVFVLGMNEGQFPRAGHDKSILSHWERRELARYNVELDPGSDRQRLDEHFLGYVAFTRASRLLIVSRPMSDEAGRPTYPSVFWRRLQDLLPAVKPTEVPREMQSPRDIRRIATPRQLVGSVMQWAREDIVHAGSAPRTDGPTLASPGTSGEGNKNAPHPNPLPEYREREKRADAGRREEALVRGADPTNAARDQALLPSPGTPGEGQGEGLGLWRQHPGQQKNAPHPSPLPEYREREKRADGGRCDEALVRGADPTNAVRDQALLPSPGTPGEGQGEGLALWRQHPGRRENAPHPSPLPEYREREKAEAVENSSLQPGNLDADPRAALYQWLARRYPLPGAADAADPIGTLVSRAWKALSYSYDAGLSPDTARRLFPAPLQASVAELETFARCPFRHFVRYGVRLTGRDEPRVTGLDMNLIYHRVLQLMAADLLERGLDWSDLDPEPARRMIEMFAGNVARGLRGEVMLSSARNKYLLSRIERTLQRVVRSLREMQARGSFRPVEADIGFGPGGKLPAYHLRTPGGRDLQLSGRIDRIDALNADKSTIPAFAVYDYKLAAGAISFAEVLYGLSLQLLSYLMVLKCRGEPILGKPLMPAAAFYYPLLRRIRAVNHPSDALPETDPLSALVRKPRGVFDARFFPALDDSAEPGEPSHVVQARLKMDGQLGYRDSSDFVTTGELAALLEFVEQKLGKIGDQIIAGKIDVKPYRLGKETPCPNCEYRSICRFEPGPGSYRHLTPVRRQDALVTITQNRQGGGNGA